MFLSPASFCSFIACAALLLSGCGARTELGVALSSDAGVGSGECPGLARPPSCPDAGNPWLLFDYGSGAGDPAWMPPCAELP